VDDPNRRNGRRPWFATERQEPGSFTQTQHEVRRISA
jgi:hypothetical protein